ncbi:LuxR C-terminal-related transcriptional regulator [Umezawaea endophytica]|uniref:LuxR C-terminal-related transcriptional regulator n=1 Tax=Umezawaea endophytica TaxID=1654476 RepID=A0A9X2VIH6_9PSEU|nr:LuxR family transcriptional regulator [Umezawaea endophytica]MCS7477291.1 LuxR C-terminal-related transcriptional regulator [Umezawaea endophytica]
MSIAVHGSVETRPDLARAQHEVASDLFASLLASDDRPGVRVVPVAERSDLGRTRLLDAYALLAGGNDLPVVRGRAVEGAQPYGLFADAFEHATGNPEVFTELEQDANLLLRGLFRSLRTPGWASEALGVPDAEHHRLHRAVTATLDAMSGPAGTVLLLDDAHHVDQASIGLLDHLVRRGPRTPILLVVAHDPLRSPAALTAVLAEAERHRADERIAPVVRLGDASRHRLTQREFTVLAVLAEGLTADAIARRLDISPRTVHRHLQHLYRKLGTADRLATVLHAKSLGLLP